MCSRPRRGSRKKLLPARSPPGSALGPVAFTIVFPSPLWRCGKNLRALKGNALGSFRNARFSASLQSSAAQHFRREDLYPLPSIGVWVSPAVLIWILMHWLIVFFLRPSRHFSFILRIFLPFLARKNIGIELGARRKSLLVDYPDQLACRRTPRRREETPGAEEEFLV